MIDGFATDPTKSYSNPLAAKQETTKNMCLNKILLFSK